eukprot:CAMPEP_0171196398 /NCGR_PEP_ID=MMETSP0790-20130122/21883_1 /TAXON_ID=2925 /ORGANISM="Alexandrium catenella, Strain OF101" /LENGTH=176 /DNA_ID=CAMNT_0011661623 /DNA_START=484 /DNA_END=1014 /DNA_ORIENTATION=-
MGRVSAARASATLDPRARENKGVRVAASRHHRAQGRSCVLFDDGVTGAKHQERVQLSVSFTLRVLLVRLVQSHVAELRAVENRCGAWWPGVRSDTATELCEIDSMALLPAHSAHHELDLVVTLRGDVGVGIEIHVQVVARAIHRHLLAATLGRPDERVDHPYITGQFRNGVDLAVV